MNLVETHDLLTFVAACDNRRFDDATVIAWQSLLGDLGFAECRNAVAEHFRTADAYLMPVHIHRLVQATRRERRRLEREEREAQELRALAAVPRTDRSKELMEIARGFLPKGDPDKLRWGHRRWRELHQADRRQPTEPLALDAGRDGAS